MGESEPSAVVVVREVQVSRWVGHRLVADAAWPAAAVVFVACDELLAALAVGGAVAGGVSAWHAGLVGEAGAEDEDEEEEDVGEDEEDVGEGHRRFSFWFSGRVWVEAGLLASGDVDGLSGRVALGLRVVWSAVGVAWSEAGVGGGEAELEGEQQAGGERDDAGAAG